MVFTTPVFLFLFLPFTLGMYFLMQKRYRNAFLFVMSSAFYFFGEQKMLFLMYGVILLNYCTALLFTHTDNKITNNLITQKRGHLIKKSALVVCIAICIGLLWYFKYWHFSIDIFNKTAAFLGINYHLSQVDKILLPLGISFYTFHVLSYTFDVYMGKMKADKNLLNFMAYVLMFPQLVAGPIVRYIDIQKQFEHRTISINGFSNGIRRFCFGFAKKVLIANTVAKAADKIFALPPEQIDFATAWLGAVCYTLQIYFDFSGYSDMAIGLAALFGFKYKENFNYPYISKTVGEFWRRWHISLSTWLRDYVYINLGGNRSGRLKYYFNILFVFLCSGLWHGANMTFVLWGAWYGVFIIIESIFLKKFLQNKNILAHIYALLVIIFGWVLFRADNVSYAIKYWQQMLKINTINWQAAGEYLQNDVLIALIFGIIFSIDWRIPYKKLVCYNKTYIRFWAFKTIGYGSAFLLFIISVMSIMSNTYNPFIYFRF